MKAFLTLPTFLIIVGALLISSCEIVDIKIEEGMDEGEKQLIYGPSQIPSEEETIALFLHRGNAKFWTSEGFTLSGVSGFQQCRLDDVIVLKEDGTYQYNGGEILCGAEDNQKLKTGTWEINFDEGTLLIFNPGTQNEYQALVTGLEENTIVLSGSYFGLEVQGIYVSN